MKQSGLGDQLFVEGYDIGADTQSIGGISTPRTVIEMTGITKLAHEREYGKRDGSAEWTSYFNDAADAEHEILKTLPRTNVNVMYLRGQGLGSPAACTLGKQVNYDPTRGEEGDFTFEVNVQSTDYGLDWCEQLTAGKQTDASATNTTGVDFGTGSKSFGFQAYLQVFSIGSGTATVKIQESSDNGVGDTFADVSGGAFAAVTGRTAERIQSVSATLTVERYLRVVTTGTFTNLVFAVAVNRNNALRAI